MTVMMKPTMRLNCWYVGFYFIRQPRWRQSGKSPRHGYKRVFSRNIPGPPSSLNYRIICELLGIEPLLLLRVNLSLAPLFNLPRNNIVSATDVIHDASNPPYPLCGIHYSLQVPLTRQPTRAKSFTVAYFK